MKNPIIINVVIGIAAILCVIYGFKLSDAYLSAPSKDDIVEYKRFCDEGVTATAHFDKEYSETNFKLGKLPSSKIFSIKYFYSVEGVEYTGERVSNNVPEVDSIQVTYLRGDPSKSKWTKNTCDDYNTMQDKQKSVFYVIIGGVMFFGGLGALSNLWKKFKGGFGQWISGK